MLPIEIETQRALLGLLREHMPGMLVANLVVASVFAAMYRIETGSVAIAGWWLVLVLVNLLRAGWNHWLENRLAWLDMDRLDMARRIHAFFAGVSGLAWGGLAVIAFNGEAINQDFIALAVAVGMVGGAVTPLSSLKWAFPFYGSAILLPFIFKAYLLGGTIYVSGGLTLSVYLVVLLSYGRSIHRTLTESFRVRLEKDELIRELEALTQSRSLFLAGVSHDLKQPVQALGMFTACLKGMAGEVGGERGREITRLADNCAEALGAIGSQVSRLLELSRLEAGEVRPQLRAIPLAELFEQIRFLQADKARAKGLRLRFVTTDQVVMSDVRMLRSILDNLVGNAVRYTTAGSVLVGARRHGAMVEIQVLDTGPGIAEAHLPLLFEAYRRFDDTTESADIGHGLGLALVHKQAELLGHDLHVCSVIGRGSRFSIRVPLARRPDSI
ncbi:MAG: HAMP domain-containing histidine kinase [Thiobacillus sp.]|nr:HAMP domain-containing histidine kinase [Thiobacillus sp.]